MCFVCFAGLHFLKHICFAGLYFLGHIFCWTIFSETYVLLVIEGLSFKSIGTTQLMCLGIIEVQTIVS